MVVLLLVLAALVAYTLLSALKNQAPDVVIWFLFALLAGLGWLLYLNFDDVVALWVAIKNLPNTVTTFITDTWNDIRAAMTGWAWAACILFLVVGMAIGGVASWVSGKVVRAVQVGRFKRERDQAREDLNQERKKAKQAEETRKRDRTIIAKVKHNDMRMSRQAGKDRGQRISAVGELKRRREREGKLREELAEARREIERLKRALPPESETQ